MVERDWNNQIWDIQLLSYRGAPQQGGTTLQLLWQEHKEANPDGYQYSYFCKIYQSWFGTQNGICPECEAKLYAEFIQDCE